MGNRLLPHRHRKAQQRRALCLALRRPAAHDRRSSRQPPRRAPALELAANQRKRLNHVQARDAYFGPSHVTMHNRPSIIPEFPPPLSDGTNPIQAARLRPEENVFQSPISATNAVAPIGPIPGISAKAPARLTPEVKGHDVLVVAASHRWRKTGTRHDP